MTDIDDEIAINLGNLLVVVDENCLLDKDQFEVLKAAHNELLELNSLFNIQWEATQKAIKMWQDKTGETNIWPDHKELLLFLMDKVYKKVHKQEPPQSHIPALEEGDGRKI